MSLFREAPNPDGSKGPLSFRRVAAAWCSALFGAATIGVILNLNAIASLGNAAIGVSAVLCGLPLVGVLALLFFTTWSDVAAIVAAAKRP